MFTTQTTMQSTIDPLGVSMSDIQEDGYGFDLDYMNNYNYGDSDYEYNEYIYPGFPFERTLYVYIWGILVILTFLANIVVICVLLRKNMRNPTNLILVGIAISDSLTGLVTLPAYWAVYSKFEPAYNYSDYELTSATNDYENSTYNTSTRSTLSPSNDSAQEHIAFSSQEGYPLKKSLCNYFMITKYFLSKSFHTVSIWLTLFLGFQRFISVAAPFRAQTMFTKLNTVILCVVICSAAPLLHIYHLVDQKAVGNSGFCQWDVEETCKGDCAYLIIAFLLRHFLPCMLLIIFTVLFVINLKRSSARISQIDSNQGNSSMHHRDSENRRVSFIVIAIVIVFLIPEVPYGCFLFYVLIGRFTQAKTELDLETNRAIHLAYEVSLVVSFHFNFYIYTFFNKRFRRTLLKLIVYPFLSLCGYHKTVSLDSRSSFTSKRRTAKSETLTRLEMVNMVGPPSSGIHQSSTIDRKTTNGNGHLEKEDTNEPTEQNVLISDHDHS